MTAQAIENGAKAGQRRALFDLGICLGLLLATFALYAQVLGFDFVNYDDDQYVYQNPRVQAGLTPASVQWALTAPVVGNWSPVTMLSHLATVELFDMASGMHHLVNLLLHAASAVLLFLLLRRATCGVGVSAFVAFVFAVHPLHVESVAWVSERKDVLSAFFWFLALYFYVRYTERPNTSRYLLMAAALCFGLLSKPMLVTFPFTLLLFDVWPLRRFQWPRAVTEKLPLFVLCAGASAVTYTVQKSAGAIVSIPVSTRIANIFISYFTYIKQAFWPTSLAVFYPHPGLIPYWHAAAAFAGVVAVSALTILAWRTRPYLAVGWFWFLGTLAPVIGLVQVGMQAHADRYMYIPLVGLSLMLAGTAADIVRTWPRAMPVIAMAGVAVCAAYGAIAWKQTSYWQNGGTLFEHTIAVTHDNWLAENDLGIYLNSVGRGSDAIRHFETALSIKPNDAHVEDGLGTSLASIGNCTAAIPHFESAIRLWPELAKPNYNLGYCKSKDGDDAGAIPYFETAIRDDPDFVNAHVRLGVSLAKVGRTQEAIGHLEQAQRIHPDPAVSKMLAGLLARR